MPNVDGKYGFALHQDNSHSGLDLCIISSGDGTATFVGDAVKYGGSADSIVGSPLVKTVVQAAATDPIQGIVMGFLPHWSASGDLTKRYRPASTAMYCLVKPAHPLDVYRIQCDDDSETVTAASVGSNADIIVGSGNTATGMSGMELDSSSVAATAGLQVKVVGIVDTPDNTIGVSKQDVLVTINQSVTFNDAGTAGTSE